MNRISVMQIMVRSVLKRQLKDICEKQKQNKEAQYLFILISKIFFQIPIAQQERTQSRLELEKYDTIEDDRNKNFFLANLFL